jgi:hypothetical protein
MTGPLANEGELMKRPDTNLPDLTEPKLFVNLLLATAFLMYPKSSGDFGSLSKVWAEVCNLLINY